MDIDIFETLHFMGCYSFKCNFFKRNYSESMENGKNDLKNCIRSFDGFDQQSHATSA